MIKYVIDASVATECLLRTSLGLKIAELIEGALLIAPEPVDVEVLSVLRRAVLQGKLEEYRALLALEDLRDWQVDRISHAALLKQAWQFRNNVSAYDAFYVIEKANRNRILLYIRVLAREKQCKKLVHKIV